MTTTKPTPPVDHAVATEPCTKCGAAIGVPCKVEIFGVFHDGAHHARLDAAYPRKPTPTTTGSTP